jgi:Fur family ferric uptake transcriptional regulator
MTVSPRVAPLEARSLAEAAAALRERGLRLSSTRRLLLEALFEADGPVSAERVARGLNLDRASVHRNFETLERHGLVRHVHLGHGPGLYALLGEGEREYLYCERCGAVITLRPKDFDPIRRRIAQRYGFQTRFSHFAIVGTCARCAAGDAVADADADADAGAVHEHAHSHHSHQHAGHEHEHSHGDHIHSHQHSHKAGLADRHEHGH